MAKKRLRVCVGRSGDRGDSRIDFLSPLDCLVFRAPRADRVLVFDLHRLGPSGESGSSVVEPFSGRRDRDDSGVSATKK